MGLIFPSRPRCPAPRDAFVPSDGPGASGFRPGSRSPFRLKGGNTVPSGEGNLRLNILKTKTPPGWSLSGGSAGFWISEPGRLRPYPVIAITPAEPHPISRIGLVHDRTRPNSGLEVPKYERKCSPSRAPHGMSARTPARACARGVLVIAMLIALMVDPTVLLEFQIKSAVIYTLG